MKLWLDDIRPAPVGWTHAATVAAAQQLLQAGEVSEASLDHDLGACEACMGGRNAEAWMAEADYAEMPHCEHVGTGYTLVLWMAEHGIWPATKPVVHSMNAVGRDRMRGAIERYFPRQEV